MYCMTVRAESIHTHSSDPFEKLGNDGFQVMSNNVSFDIQPLTEIIKGTHEYRSMLNYCTVRLTVPYNIDP